MGLPYFICMSYSDRQTDLFSDNSSAISSLYVDPSCVIVLAPISLLLNKTGIQLRFSFPVNQLQILCVQNPILIKNSKIK